MARFLSEEWFAQVRDAVAGPTIPVDPGDPSIPVDPGDPGDTAHPVDPGDPGDTAHPGEPGHPGDTELPVDLVTVRHRVTGGPDGDVDYVVRAGSGRFSVERGVPGPVDIEIVEDYDSASAISQGHLTPAAAFATGRLKLRGHVALLAERQGDFATLGQLLAPVRAATTY